MEDAGNERFVSHATPWEMAIKLALGKLQLQPDFSVIFPGVLDANGFAMLPPKFEHYHALIALPSHHGDPFDRLIIAQAKVEGLEQKSKRGHSTFSLVEVGVRGG
jgi:PIN domain nuclease of toxin-antitoxin system